MWQVIINNLGTILVILVVVGPILANIFGALAKGKNPPSGGGSSSSGGSGSSGARRSRLDEMAARRRAELSQGSAGSSSSSSGGAGGQDPSNLTMAERIARARAKAQYEQRSAQLGQRRGGTGRGVDDSIEVEVIDDRRQPDPYGREDRQRREAAEALERRRAAERQQAELAARRRREAAEARQRESARRQQDQARQAQQQRTAQQRQPAPPARKATTGKARRQPSHGLGEIDTDAIARGEVGQGESARRLESAELHRGGRGTSGHREASVFGVRLTRRTMRHAVVLREILDPPVSMREGVPGMASVATRG